MKTLRINPKNLIFNMKVRQACKSCKHYGFKTTCPPHIEDIKYFKKVLQSYKCCVVVFDEFKADKQAWENIGKESSLKIHNYLLMRRKELIARGNYFYTILGAGSCKLCKKCTFPCSQPAKSLIPIEGTGIDLVATLKKYKINIRFPIGKSFYRIGMILYD